MKFLALFLFCLGAHAQVAPPEHRRGAEQTFLTYPEWFLVHSPAEYAEYVRDHTSTQFPFIGHTCQFWQGYGAVTRRDARLSVQLRLSRHGDGDRRQHQRRVHHPRRRTRR